MPMTMAKSARCSWLGAFSQPSDAHAPTRRVLFVGFLSHLPGIQLLLLIAVQIPVEMALEKPRDPCWNLDDLVLIW